jgi:hypothetical protein
MTTLSNKNKLDRKIKNYRKSIRQISSELVIADEQLIFDFDLELHNIAKKLVSALNKKNYLKN